MRTRVLSLLASTVLVAAGAVAVALDNERMAELASKGGRRLLDSAFLEEEGSWSAGWHEDGSLESGSIWWGFAELDQLAATIALTRPQAARTLPRTYAFWLTYFAAAPGPPHGSPAAGGAVPRHQVGA